MPGYQERLSILKSVESILATEESPSTNILDGEIESLQRKIETKKADLQYLNARLEAYQADSEVQDELSNCYFANIKQEIDVLKQKDNVLKTYIKVLTSPEVDNEFSIIRLKEEQSRYVQEFWSKLKPHSERVKVMKDQVAKLRELYERYMEIKQRADNSMI